MNLNPIAKAIAAGVTSALSVLYALTGVVDVTVGPHEWIAVAMAFLAGLGFTYSVPNTPPSAGVHLERDGESGGVDLTAVVVMVILLLIVLVALGRI